jgi:hypothetical protein
VTPHPTDAARADGEAGFELDLGQAAKHLAGGRFSIFASKGATFSQHYESALLRHCLPQIARAVALALQASRLVRTFSLAAQRTTTSNGWSGATGGVP